MAGEETAAALFLALAVGGGAIAASHLVQEKQIKKASKQVSNHSHNFENIVHKNGYSEQDVFALQESHNHSIHPQISNFANLRQEMSDHETTRYDSETGVYVGHPLGLESDWEYDMRRQRVVPAYKMRRGLRTVLPARIENNHESNYFYDRLKKGANRTNWPNYDQPKYLMYAAESEEGRKWVTMEDLARALEALNGKVELYRNAIYADMKEYGHSHNNTGVLT